MGYAHGGLVTTAKKLGFVQEPSRLCPAARRKAEFFFLGEREQKLALCKEPTVFRSLLAQRPPPQKKNDPNKSDARARARCLT